MKYILLLIILVIIYYIDVYKYYESFNNKQISVSNKLIYPIYWINLDKNQDRKSKLINQFNKYNINNHVRIDAIDGSKINNRYNNSIYFTQSNHMETIKNGQLGCLLSHLKAIIKAYTNNLNRVIIVEDDICFGSVKYWPYTLDDIISQAPKDWEILHLHISNIKYTNQLIQTTKPFVPWKSDYYSSLCYIINKKGIRKIIDLIYKQNKIFLPCNYTLVADYMLYMICKTYTYTKPLFIYGNYESNINPNINITMYKQKYLSNIIHKYYNINSIKDC
jgi:GR25 family glycosyltransferase involved in LPS biosynthesis